MTPFSRFVTKTGVWAGASIGLLFIIALPVFAAPGNDTLMGYWKLDETVDGTCGGGADVCDYSGDGNHGAFMGGMAAPAALSPVKENTFDFPNTYGYVFDGEDDYINFGNVASVTTNDFTLATWFKTSDIDAAQQVLISKQGGGYFMALNALGQLYFNITNNIDGFINDSKGADYRDGQWHHATITFDRDADAVFYIDGAQIGTTDISSLNVSLGDEASPLWFGQSGNNSWLNGSMDDVRVYSRVLSADEIADLAAGRHTSAAWDGSESFDYEVAANWNTGAVPDPYTHVMIFDGPNYPSTTADIALAGLTIQSNTYLNLSDDNLSINDSGVFLNEGTLYLNGDETLIGFTNDTNSGTVFYTGSGVYTGLPAGNSYYRLGFNDATGSWTLDAPLNVNSDLVLDLGTLSTDGYTINVGGKWDRDPGATFNHDNGTVILDGEDQHIWSDNTFYNLTKTSPGASDTLYFDAGKTQTILNSVTLTSTRGTLLGLLSTIVGNKWYIDLEPGATDDVEYVYLQDSEATGETPFAVNSFDGDRNVNWTFTDTVDPSAVSVTLPANGTYDPSENLDFTVSYDESVSVETTGGTPRLKLTIGSTTRYAAYTSGSGTKNLLFRYTVQAGDNDNDGIELDPDVDFNGGVIEDASGRDAGTDLGTIGSLEAILVGDATVSTPPSGGSRGGGYAPGYGPNTQTNSESMSIEEMLSLVAELQTQLAELRVQLGDTEALPDTVRDLEVGSTGTDVHALQSLLIALGYSIPDGPTNYFGEQTRSALSAYQSENSIVPSAGYFGPLTRTRMKAAGLTGLWW